MDKKYYEWTTYEIKSNISHLKRDIDFYGRLIMEGKANYKDRAYFREINERLPKQIENLKALEDNKPLVHKIQNSRRLALDTFYIQKG